jgi:signal peptidase I
MEPTLYGANDMGKGFGDHLLVWHSAYGFNSRIKIPFINWYYPLPKYRIMVPGLRLPKVGDVVVFENPTNAKIDYIKRCAGTPGDKIKIVDRFVTILNQNLEFDEVKLEAKTQLKK